MGSFNTPNVEMVKLFEKNNFLVIFKNCFVCTHLLSNLPKESVVFR